MTGYKVLDNRKNGKYSLVIRYGGGVEYSDSEWNNPKENWGPICVLPTIELALEFTKMYGTMAIGEVEVWEIEYIQSVEEKVWQCFTSGNRDETEKFVLFSGTILADSVKLIRLKQKGV